MSKNGALSYLMTKDKVTIPTLTKEKEFGEYTLYIGDHTPFYCVENKTSACAILGFAVNLLSEEEINIANEVIENCRSVDDLVDYEQHLGGKYILIYRCGEQYFMMGDATCSIPIFYSKEDSLICSSSTRYIAKLHGFSPDDELSLIRASGDISQAMPYDVTPYRQIKQLIPNHYLDMNRQTSIRFTNTNVKQKELSVKEATEISLPLIEKLLAFYLRNFNVYCPITSGRDSRVVLSFLMKSKANFTCYTIRHPEHNNNAQDIVIPIQLCKKENIPHRLIEDSIVPEGVKSAVDEALGSDCYSSKTLRIAYTINEYFGDGAVINGDIIGQVGKCSLHRDIPTVFASPSYFLCKLHNYSKGAKTLLKKWLAEIKESGEQINTFDLFSIENRMGCWAGQENLIYNTLGQMYLNIFNSRSIIYVWTAVAREKRKKSLLHSELIEHTYKDLLGIPFEKDESIVIKFSKSTGMIYLISSYLKFYFEKMQFEKGKRNEKTDNNRG